VDALLHHNARVTEESIGADGSLLVRGPSLHGHRHGVCVSSIL
jgi:hypothetical protein